MGVGRVLETSRPHPSGKPFDKPLPPPDSLAARPPDPNLPPALGPASDDNPGEPQRRPRPQWQSLRTAVCLRCCYPLRGLCEPVCPECGQPFDPFDPYTWQQSRTAQGWPRFVGSWRDIPSRRLTRVMFLFVLSVFLRFSAVDRDLQSYRILAARVNVLTLAILIGLTVFYFHVRSRWERIGPASSIGMRRRRMAVRTWRMYPISLALLGAFIVYPQGSSHLRWAISRPFFISTATRIASEPPGTTRDDVGFLGLCRVSRVAVRADGRIEFRLASGYVLKYDPANPETNLADDFGPGWGE